MITGIKCDECGLPEIVDIHKKPGHYFHKFVPNRPRTDEEGALRNGGGEVNELSERTKHLGKLAYWKAFEYAERPDNGVLEIAELIEQALLAERALARRDAMEEAAKIADNRAEREEHIRSVDWSAQLLGVGAAKAIAEELRAAAEKEVG